jgi:hypothetical protein
MVNIVATGTSKRSVKASAKPPAGTLRATAGAPAPLMLLTPPL